MRPKENTCIREVAWRFRKKVFDTNGIDSTHAGKSEKTHKGGQREGDRWAQRLTSDEAWQA